MQPTDATRFIDVHHHVGPDAYVRRHTATTAGEHYRALGGWVVLKNHLGCTAAQAWEARQNGLPVSGSIVLNDLAGGIDPRAVQRAVVQQGEDSGLRLIAHLPTVTGRAHRSRLKRALSHPVLERDGLRPLTVTEDGGPLRPEVRELMRAARDLPVVVSTGHADGREVRLLVDEAVRLGVRLMLNQPANPMTGLSYADLVEVAAADVVWTEQTALTYLLGYQDESDFEAVLARLPRTLYSSDLGQTSQMDIDEWHRTSHKWFESAGLDAARITEVTRTAPLTMLAL